MRVDEPNEPLVKITTNLYSHDYEVLRRIFKRYGYQRALRLKVRKWVRSLEAKIDRVKEDDDSELEQLISGDSASEG